MSDVQALLSAVRAIEPVLRQHAPVAERQRRLSSEAVAAMRDASLFRMWRPKALGGLELDPVSAFRVLEEVSSIDSAAGWVLQISNALEPFGAWYSPEVAQEIFGSPDAVFAGSFNPPSEATPVDGGYMLTGRTRFNSGAHHAQWVFGQATIRENGNPRMRDGHPELLLIASAADQVEIVDNWDTMGMRGTGSHDVKLARVFVPSRMAVPLTTKHPNNAYYEGPLYRLGVWPTIAALAPPALGIARAAIESAISLATEKVPAYLTKTLRDRSVVQRELALAHGEVSSGRVYLFHVFGQLYDKVCSGQPLTMDDKASAQLAVTNAVRSSARAVSRIHEIVGASGIREEQPFERHFRDVHVITQHAYIDMRKLESVGQIMLRLEPEWPFFAL